MVSVAGVLAAAVLAGGPQVTLDPPVAQRDGQVRITVTGLPGASASVRLAGGLASRGRWFNWVPLISTQPGSWRTVLRAPGFLGVYPVQVRAAGHLVTTNTNVEILPRGFAHQPAFLAPRDVAVWWTRIAPPGATLTSAAAWHSGFFTHRDDTLNRLLRVRFTLLGPWPQLHLHAGAGVIYLSIARLSPDGAWRLLEATKAP